MTRLDASALGSVRVALCETNTNLRVAIQAALYQRGFREPALCRDSEALLALLESQIVDLVICSVDLPGRDFSELMQLIRQQQAGRNPFTVVLATIADASDADIRSVINDGVDHVVKKPFSMADILSCVDNLAASRKPFVATRDYIGPSRREALRPDRSAAEVLVVPNSLRAKLRGRVAMGELERLIRDSMSGLLKLRSCNSCMAASHAIKRLVTYFNDDANRDRALTELDRLVAMSDEIEQRYRGTDKEHFSKVAVTLTKLVHLLRTLPPDATRSVTTTLELMKKLGDIIGKIDRNEPGAVTITYQIAQIVGSFAASVQ